MKKDKDVFYTTKNNKVAHFDPNKQNKTKNAKPWEAMNRNGKILKKTITIPKNAYSKDEPEYEEGYKKEYKSNEIKSAKFAQKLTGKKVKLLTEKKENKFNPDANIEGKYVDFKNPEPKSKNGIDTLTRHGLEQINYFGKENAGFVFHEADSVQKNKAQINKQVIGRMARSKDKNGYVIVKKKDKLFIYRRK